MSVLVRDPGDLPATATAAQKQIERPLWPVFVIAFGMSRRCMNNYARVALVYIAMLL